MNKTDITSWIKNVGKRIAKSLASLIPNRNIIILESGPDFQDNTYWFLKYLVEQKNIQSRYKLVWFLFDMNNARKEIFGAKIVCVNRVSTSLKWRLVKAYYRLTASIIIDCNRPIHKLKEKQFRIFLGHGMPLKIPKEYTHTIGEADFVPILGEGFRDYYSKRYRPEAVFSFGYPRNEHLFTSSDSKKKYIVWLPTYRQHRTQMVLRMENSLSMGIPVIKSESDLSVIDQILGECGAYLLIRPHPAQDLSLFKVSNHKNILIADDAFLAAHNIQLYELLSKSMGLITDYSSVYYDYLLTGKPIGLTLEDAEEVSKKWPFFFDDIKNDLKGFKIYTLQELVSFICDTVNGKDPFKVDREKLRMNLGISKQPSSQLIYEFIKEKLSK